MKNGISLLRKIQWKILLTTQIERPQLTTWWTPRVHSRIPLQNVTKYEFHPLQFNCLRHLIETFHVAFFSINKLMNFIEFPTIRSAKRPTQPHPNRSSSRLHYSAFYLFSEPSSNVVTGAWFDRPPAHFLNKQNETLDSANCLRRSLSFGSLIGIRFPVSDSILIERCHVDLIKSRIDCVKARKFV